MFHQDKTMEKSTIKLQVSRRTCHILPFGEQALDEWRYRYMIVTQGNNLVMLNVWLDPGIIIIMYRPVLFFLWWKECWIAGNQFHRWKINHWSFLVGGDWKTSIFPETVGNVILLIDQFMVFRGVGGSTTKANDISSTGAQGRRGDPETTEMAALNWTQEWPWIGRTY